MARRKHSCKKRKGAIEDLEKRAQRRIKIRTDESHVLHRCLDQGQSPLFSALPRELRNMIWEYATAPYEDESRKFKETEYYYRPDHTAELKTDTALLRTCRRVWLESHAMPMLQAEHSFYYHRPAPDRRDKEWMAGLTDSNRRNFGQLHLYAQMYAIENLSSTPGELRSYFLTKPYAVDDFQPRMLRVTLRHTDWYNWEYDERLRTNYSWIEALLNIPDLRSTETLVLELETLEYKKHQLDIIVSRLKSLVSQELETHFIEGRPTKTVFHLVDKSNIYTWEGPPEINGERFRPYREMKRLKYHVETLTWKLKFTDHPKGFIPRLRRLPRVLPSQKRPSIDHLYERYVAEPRVGRLPPWRLPSHRYYNSQTRMWRELNRFQQVQQVMRSQAEIAETARQEHFRISMAVSSTARAEIEGTLLEFLDGEMLID